jgi:glycosyltransferase involved in cell wall biosynthesis
VARRLSIGYVYRDFNIAGSIAGFFRDRAERLAIDEDVTVICSARTRASTDAPLRFKTVEPLTRGRGRLGYAFECGSFALRAGCCVRKLRPYLDVVHVVGFDAPDADIVTVNAVRPAEIARYFDEVEPEAWLRRRVASLLRPQSAVVQLVERRLFRPPFPLCLPETAAVADDLKRHYGVPEDAIEVIPAGVDLAIFTPSPVDGDPRTARPRPDDRLLVLFVGSDFERKGLDRAIRAVALAKVEVELVVVGDGPESPYRELARSLGCLRSIRFLGRVPHTELPSLYRTCDALLLPSRQDAWGQPILEALACGLVAVASERAGAHEILVDGVNGFVVGGEGAPEEIAVLLAGPLSSAETRARVGARALETARRFDREVLYRRFRHAHHTAYARRLDRMRAAAGAAR